MRRTPIVVVAATLLALGACGGGGKKAVTTAGGTTPTSSAADTTPTTAAAAGATSAAAAPSGAPAGASASPATTAKPAAHTGAAPAGAQPAPTGGSSQSAAAPNGGSGGPPAYAGKPTTEGGKYHYAVSGTTSIGQGPPPGADLAVDPPAGSSQHSQLTSGSDPNSQSSTDTTLDYQADGVHLVDLTTKSAAGTLQFHPTPAPLIFPASFAKGATVGPFDMTSTDGKEKATVKVTIQDVGVQVATGDGKSYPTIQAEVDTTLACTNPADTQCLSGTLNSTRWLGYQGLELKDHSTSNIKFGAYSFTSDITSIADKATPS